jgi:branched-chain amino acid transport system permease protein
MNNLLRPAQLIPVLLLLALAVLPPIAVGMQDNFWVSFFARVLVYAIAASALNIALGFGGLVSLGHALFIGIGMYSVSLPSYYGVSSGWVHLAACVLVCALVGCATGLISLRTSGIAFIMITLAFAQMGYFVIVSLKQYGGDDGMGITAASEFFGLQLNTPMSVYYCAWGVLVALTWWGCACAPRPLAWPCGPGARMPAASCRSAWPCSVTSWPPTRCRRCCAAWPACCWPI